MPKNTKKISFQIIQPIVFFLLLTIGFFLSHSETLAAYQYEGIGFYTQINSGYTTEGIAFYAFTDQQTNTSPVYRFYSTKTGDHFYTISESEKTTLINNPEWGYVSEGIDFYSYSDNTQPGTVPVYRFYNTKNGDHFYTISENEKTTVMNNPEWGYLFEKISFYVFQESQNNAMPVYRFYNSATGDHFYTISESDKNKLTISPVYRFYNTKNGDHFYTISENEKTTVMNNPEWGYLFEGIAFYTQSQPINNTSAIYRYYNTKNGDHFYTASETDRITLQNNPQWNYTEEGIAFYAFPNTTPNTAPIYRFYNQTTGDHFYTASEIEKNTLLRSELGPEISVGLWSNTSTELKNNPVQIDANKPYTIKDKKGNLIAQVDGNDTTKVTYSSDVYLKVYDYNNGQESRIKQVVQFDAVDGDNSTLIFNMHRPGSSYDRYRGKISLHYYDSNTTWIVNTLPLEHYVWGMGETTGTGPLEHTKVMTTIFRTYGQWYINYATKYLPYGFHIQSTSGSQIYNGYDWEVSYPNITVAAKATRGVIATYGSDVALTPYSSWSDGRTRSFLERWGSSDYPWCQSVSDPYGKHATMNTTQLEAAGNHMVGLIANGSLNLSRNSGWNYQQILKYYYTGINLNTVY